MRQYIVKQNTYRDSVNLMLLADRISNLSGIRDVAILMATPANKRRLLGADFHSDAFTSASSNDLCIGLEAADEVSAENALRTLDDFLAGSGTARAATGGPRRSAPRTLESALRLMPHASLAAISVPGEYAAEEARKALERGLHVFLFSNDVPIEAEQRLKHLAQSKGLLLMGPDCGTASIRGQPLGFCNAVSPGPVGIVAASGTGAQEVMCLLSKAEVGVSQVIGTGGRDLHDAIGGISTEQALLALSADPDTTIIMLISKPPSEAMAERILARARSLHKPVIVAFQGFGRGGASDAPIIFSDHLDHAAEIAAAITKGLPVPAPVTFAEVERQPEGLSRTQTELTPGQQYIRGLYSGGTLALEAALMVADILPNVRSGHGFGPVLPLRDWDHLDGHALVDFGDERYTQGRPHPMIDMRLRSERVIQESSDPTVAVLLLDVILGYNAHPDPAGVLAPAIKAARAAAAAAGRSLPIIAHLCGTSLDPQDIAEQRRQLQDAGCLVFDSNVKAALAAAWLVRNVDRSRSITSETLS